MIDMRNPDELWAVQKAKLKLLFTHLHDDDFYYDYGKKDVMLEQLQKKLGKSREELSQFLLTMCVFNLPAKKITSEECPVVKFQEDSCDVM